MSKEELEKFKMEDPKDEYHCPIFRVQSRVTHSHGGDLKQSMYTIRCANWVNIIPVTSKGEVVLIEQHRFGTDTFTLETPGGAVDPGENDTTMAALRELQEETGLTSQRLLSLASYPANPAIQNNRIQYFLAFDCLPLPEPVNHDDPFEKIRLHIVPFQKALEMARTGQINHALAALALTLAEPYLSSKFGVGEA